MAGLFGSGPQSNILNTVQGSYTAMLNAEKQKGQAAHEAMGAFGKAISPKAIGMTNFKNDFKDADWSKPETYARAGQQLMSFDPQAGLSMMDKGRSLAASMAPKRDMQWIDQIDPETGITTKVAVDMTNVKAGDAYTSKLPEKTDFKYTAPQKFTNPNSGIIEWKQQQPNNSWKTIGMAGDQTSPKEGDPTTKEFWDSTLQRNVIKTYDRPSKSWILTGDAPKTAAPASKATGTGMYNVPNVGEVQGFKRDGQLYYYDSLGNEKLQPSGSRLITDVIKTEVVSSPAAQWRNITTESKNDTQANPVFKTAVEQFTSVNKAEEAISTRNPASVQAAIQQITSQFDDKGRAYASTIAIQNAGSIGENLADWASKGLQGTPAPAKIEEYEALVGILKDQASINMISTIKNQSGFFSDTLPEGYTPRALTTKLLGLLPAGVNAKVLPDGGIVFQQNNGNWAAVE